MTKRPQSRSRAKLPNGARAVMAGRKEPPDSLDYFPTPPWATRALVEIVMRQFEWDLGGEFPDAWEPACGEGHMAEVLREYFDHVYASDVFDYGRGYAVGSFTGSGPDVAEVPGGSVDWIITNPPFNGSIEFVQRALDLATAGVAMFVRTQWYVEGIERYERLFARKPPTLFAPFVERVPLCRGRWDPTGTTATSYCWLVWVKHISGAWLYPRAPFHIPPGQRKALTRPDDIARFAAWSLPHQEAAE